MSDENDSDTPDEETRPFMDAKDPSTWTKPDDMTYGDWFLRPGRPLSARHRRLAEYISMGMKTGDIAERLGMTAARVSVLKSNSMIALEVKKIQERLYEETHQKRLKNMGHDALDVMHEAILDETNAYKKSEKLDAAKWILEKVTGKAIQVHDIGGNLLSTMMDRLDALKTSGQSLPESSSIDVTPLEQIEGHVIDIEEKVDEPALVETEEERKLREWVEDL
jgi:DNA-binding CsgD family transcriptional regulator